ncbi:GntR family transcriptional regulator, partial [Rhizobium ruizarguesonis]
EKTVAGALGDLAVQRPVPEFAPVGNGFFLTIFDVINRVRQDEAWKTIRERARSASRTRPVTFNQHTAIVDAIAARDPA